MLLLRPRLPDGIDVSVALENAGCAYFEFRAKLMRQENKGLTAIYNWFHDAGIESPDIKHLRELHDALDRAVLDTYGWHGIQPVCAFYPEFDDETEDDADGRSRRKKYRYRWPDEVHDEVLARLLELNSQRSAAEQLVGSFEAQRLQERPARARRGRRAAAPVQQLLIPEELSE